MSLCTFVARFVQCRSRQGSQDREWEMLYTERHGLLLESRDREGCRKDDHPRCAKTLLGFVLAEEVALARVEVDFLVAHNQSSE